jgi:hypothetical protein
MIEDARPGTKSKASIKFIEKTAKAPSAGGFGKLKLWYS